MSGFSCRVVLRSTLLLALGLILMSCSGSDPYSEALTGRDRMRQGRYLRDPLLRRGSLVESVGPGEAWSVDLVGRREPGLDVAAIARRAPQDAAWFSISCLERSVLLEGYEQVAGYQTRIELLGDRAEGTVRFQLYLPTPNDQGLNPESFESLQCANCDPEVEKELRAFAQEVGIQPDP